MEDLDFASSQHALLCSILSFDVTTYFRVAVRLGYGLGGPFTILSLCWLVETLWDQSHSSDNRWYRVGEGCVALEMPPRAALCLAVLLPRRRRGV